MFDLATEDVPSRCWTSLLSFRNGDPLTDAFSVKWLLAGGLIEFFDPQQSRSDKPRYRIAELGYKALKRGRLTKYAVQVDPRAPQARMASQGAPPHALRRRAALA
jgi:hypothetical protein